MNSIQIENQWFDEIISGEQIDEMAQQIANQLNDAYRDRNVLMVCVLNGAAPFAMNVFTRLTITTELAFVRLKSYEGEQTSGAVQELYPLSVEAKGRHIVVVEDIIDTGLTMHHYVQKLKGAGAASVTVAAMLYKSDSIRYDDAMPTYYGSKIANRFLVGYGLDYNELYRNVKAIYAKR